MCGDGGGCGVLKGRRVVVVLMMVVVAASILRVMGGALTREAEGGDRTHGWKEARGGGPDAPES